MASHHHGQVICMSAGRIPPSLLSFLSLQLAPEGSLLPTFCSSVNTWLRSGATQVFLDFNIYISAGEILGDIFRALTCALTAGENNSNVRHCTRAFDGGSLPGGARSIAQAFFRSSRMSVHTHCKPGANVRVSPSLVLQMADSNP